jgi:hypothetical protein
MMMRKTLPGALLLLTASSLLAPRSASALEDERMTSVHGTICRVTNAVTPFLSTAGVGNPSTTSALNLDCPIAINSRSQVTYLTAQHTSVDTHGNLLGNCQHTKTARAPWIEVYDRNANADVSCQLLVLGAGNVIQASFAAHSSGAQGPVQKLTFPMTAFLALNDNNQLYVQCSIPVKTTDMSYVARIGIPTCEGN